MPVRSCHRQYPRGGLRWTRSPLGDTTQLEGPREAEARGLSSFSSGSDVTIRR